MPPTRTPNLRERLSRRFAPRNLKAGSNPTSTIGNSLRSPSLHVRQPMAEDGVSFSADDGGSRRISRAIQRTWATLWGWTGDRLVRVRVSPMGSLHVIPSWRHGGTSLITTGTTTSGTASINLSASYEYHEVYLSADAGWLSMTDRDFPGVAHNVFVPPIMLDASSVVHAFRAIHCKSQVMVLTKLGLAVTEADYTIHSWRP